MLLSGLVTTSEAVTTVREESTRNSKSTYSLPKSVTKKNSTTAKGPASNTTEKTYPDGRKVRFKTNTFHTYIRRVFIQLLLIFSVFFVRILVI